MSYLDSPQKRTGYFLFHFHKAMVTVSSLLEEWMSLKKKKDSKGKGGRALMLLALSAGAEDSQSQDYSMA